MKLQVSPSLPLFMISVALARDPHPALMTLPAAALHELGHLLAARAMRVPIKSMRLSVLGAAIEPDMLRCSYKKEMILSICGPLANLITAALAFLIFGTNGNALYFIVSSVFLALLNLIPAGSFDGGRILSGLLLSFLSPAAVSRISDTVSFFCFFSLWTVSVYFIFKTGSYLSLFIFSCSLFARIFLSTCRGQP